MQKIGLAIPVNSRELQLQERKALDILFVDRPPAFLGMRFLDI